MICSGGRTSLIVLGLILNFGVSIDCITENFQKPSNAENSPPQNVSGLNINTNTTAINSTNSGNSADRTKRQSGCEKYGTCLTNSGWTGQGPPRNQPSQPHHVTTPNRAPYKSTKTNKIRINAPVFCPPRYPTTAFEFILNQPGDKPKYNDPNKGPVQPTNLHSNLPVRYDGPKISSTGYEKTDASGMVFNGPIHGGMGHAGGAMTSDSVSISGRRRRRSVTFNAPISCS